MNTFDLTKKLCLQNGSSGDEEMVAQFIQEQLPNSHTDNLGNVLALYNPSGKVKVMIEAHMDTVGYIVTGIDDAGFLSIEKAGSPDLRTSIGMPVAVYGKETIFGVISSVPPHLSSSKDKTLSVYDLSVDIGMSKDDAEKLVSIGDRVIIKSSPVSLQGSNISAPGLDDRAGVASVIIAANEISSKLKNICLSVALNTREEVGGQGAHASAFSLFPDYAICVDTGFGIDHHTNGPGTIELGGGPSIGIAPVLDMNLINQLKSIAKAKGIPFQHDVMSRTTGTNADSICNVKTGIKTALLSIPLRNMHTQVEIANIEDIENTAKLICEFILSLEENYA